MSVALKVECPNKDECKFGEGCLALHSGKHNGTYGPVLRMRVIDLKMQIRCFSFQPKDRKDINDGF